MTLEDTKMKLFHTLILTMTVMILPSLVYAQQTIVDGICTRFGNIAFSVMTDRQNNVPLSEIIDPSDNDITIHQIIIDAYRLPISENPSYKVMYVHDYAHKVYLDCYEAMLITNPSIINNIE